MREILMSEGAGFEVVELKRVKAKQSRANAALRAIGDFLELSDGDAILAIFGLLGPVLLVIAICF